MSKNIVIYYGDLIYAVNGKYYCKPGLGRFIDEISTKYKKVFYTTTIEESSLENISNYYQIKSDNIVYQNVPNNNSFVASVKNRSKINKTLKKHMKEWEDAIVYLRWPTPNVIKVYKLSTKNNLKVILHIVGDPYTIVKETSKYRGLKRILALTYSKLQEKQIKKIIKNTPTVVNGNAQRRMYNKNNNVLELISATIDKKEIVYSRKYNQNKTKLLYVGALKEEKGIERLLDAFKIMLSKDVNFELNIVGDGPQKDELISKTKELQISDNVKFHGYVPLGEKLMNVYLSNDIFVLPSLSEGTPRVLLEAMAFGLPVIASNVGGIPFTIKNDVNGFLFDDVDSLIKKVFLVKDNQEIRMSLIKNGYLTVENNTLEVFVNKIINFIIESGGWFGRNKR